MNSAIPSFDIFCRVIDNYGDIGVCWRLARQLAAQGAPAVRLWVDDLHAFARIESAINPRATQQCAQGVEVVLWSHEAPDLVPHEVVIEAFACDLPASFMARMIKQDSLCVNLEYLSAEKWVEDCHALPSIQPNGLRKCFFFPGFTESTGGLLREPSLLETRNHWLARPAGRWALLQGIGMPSHLLQGLQAGWRQVYLFCYADAPVAELVRALNAHPTPTVLMVPTNTMPSLKALGNSQVHVFETPFVSQDNFDRLLWSSDLNIVRGEDSMVRAIWAGKPFLWHIYVQHDDAHLVKLRAWLARSPYSDSVQTLMLSWNTADLPLVESGLHEVLSPPAWPAWQAGAMRWSEKLAVQADLAQSLVGFCARTLGKG